MAGHDGGAQAGNRHESEAHHITSKKIVDRVKRYDRTEHQIWGRSQARERRIFQDRWGYEEDAHCRIRYKGMEPQDASSPDIGDPTLSGCLPSGHAENCEWLEINSIEPANCVTEDTTDIKSTICRGQQSSLVQLAPARWEAPARYPALRSQSQPEVAELAGELPSSHYDGAGSATAHRPGTMPFNEAEGQEVVRLPSAYNPAGRSGACGSFARGRTY